MGADQTPKILDISDFKGLVSNASPHALAPGAAVEQSNIQILRPGVLSVRKGTRLATFTGSPAAVSSIIGLGRFTTSTDTWTLIQGADGSLHAETGAG